MDYPLIRAIKSGFCTFRELNDGTLTMRDVWIINDMLDLEDYIEANLQEKMRQEAERK